jgi:hypothetical protein
MTAITYINGANQEQPVTSGTQLPTSAIDGYTTATIAVVSISGGATPVVPATRACRAIDLFNNTGADLEYTRTGATPYFPIPNGTGRLITAISNANQISFRRIDQSATTVTLSIEVLA